MACLTIAGAESGVMATGLNPFIDGVSTSGGVVDTAHVRTGTYAYKIDSTGANTTCAIQVALLANGTSGVTYYLRAYVYLTAYPTADVAIMGLINAQVRLLTTGKVQLYNPAVGVVGSASADALQLNAWYRLELKMTFQSAANDDVEFRLDGQTIAAESAAYSSTGSLGSQIGWFNAPGANLQAWFDDIVLYDSTGSTQNSWPGAGRVVMLKPTADSAGGTGWTLGTGTALGGNGFGSVDNAPSVGVADLAVGSDPKQIRNAAAAANSNYDATMQSYNAAGVSGIVNAVIPIVVTAAPVTTGAKLGTIGVSSNPVIANVALAAGAGAGAVAGAFWGGVAAAAYPTGWKASLGTMTGSPSVALGTAPVVRVTQVTSSTRIAMVSLMGLYVDFTPPIPPTIREPIAFGRAIGQAVNRAASY